MSPHPSRPKNDICALTQVVVVLLHGDRFNECQWMYARSLMYAHGWHERASLVALNLFSGPFLRDHSPATGTLADCSAIAIAQINAHLHHTVRLGSTLSTHARSHGTTILMSFAVASIAHQPPIPFHTYNTPPSSLRRRRLSSATAWISRAWTWF